MEKDKCNNKLTAWLYLLLCSVIWGSSCILMKKGLKVFSAEEVWAQRIFFASVFFMPIAFKRMKTVTLCQFRKIFIVGLFNVFIPAFLFAKAQTRLDSSINGALNSLTPVFALLAGSILYREHVSFKKLVGAILGIIGTILLILPTNNSCVVSQGINIYCVLPIIGCMMYGVCLNLVKRDLSNFSSLTINSMYFLPFGIIAGSFLFLSTDFLHKLQHVDGAYNALLCTVTLGISGSAIANMLYTHLIQITSAVFASIVSLILPLVAFVWGMLDGEVLSLAHYTGVGIILVGVYLINR